MEACIRSVVLLLACVGAVIAQAPIKVTIRGDKKIIKEPGQSVVMMCNVNKGLELALYGAVQWIRHDANNQDHMITSTGNVADPFLGFYEVNVDHSTTEINATITILNVQDVDDGNWSCVALYKGKVEAQDQVHIQVLKPVTDVTLEIAKQKFKKKETSELQLEEGTYSLSCTAAGSNPAAVVAMYLDSRKLPAEAMTDLVDDSGEVPLYKTEFKANPLVLTEKAGTQMLLCEAHTHGMSVQPKEAGIRISVFSHKPKIFCTNKTTSLGSRYVKLTCIVTHTQAIDQVVAEIGDTNTVLFNGNKSADNTIFMTERINSTALKATLDIDKINEKHFTHTYYINVKVGNKNYREPVVLQNMGGGQVNGNSSPGVFVTLGQMVMILLVSLAATQWC